jgi:SAM-dependent methyltransferase
MTDATPPERGSYLYDQAWEQERNRLAALALIYDPGTLRLLDQLGVAPGWDCLEVGAGEGSVTRWMSERVGPSGRVLAVDLDPRFIEPSDIVEVRQHDILEGPPEAGAFDVVHARAVVEWVTDRPRALANMAAALKPGGVLLVEDVDVEPGYFGYPPNELRRLALEAFATLGAAVGADLTFGRQLRVQLERLGLVDMGNDVRMVLQRGGEPTTDFQRLTLAQLGPAMRQTGIFTDDQLVQIKADLDDPAVYGYSPAMVAVWGVRPKSSA